MKIFVIVLLRLRSSDINSRISSRILDLTKTFCSLLPIKKWKFFKRGTLQHHLYCSLRIQSEKEVNTILVEKVGRFCARFKSSIGEARRTWTRDAISVLQVRSNRSPRASSAYSFYKHYTYYDRTESVSRADTAELSFATLDERALS